MIFRVLHRILSKALRIGVSQRDVIIFSALIGFIVGWVSVLFYYLLLYIEHEVALVISEDGLDLWWLTPLIVGFGGLVSGLIVYGLAPEAEGHGTDAVISAFHRRGSITNPKAPLVKFLASIATIGTGGSAGREGPMAQIGAGIASIFSRLFNSPINFQRLSLLVGLAAGVGAMFKAPLGGAVFAIEVVYRRDFESEALIPAFIASLTGYAVMGYATGFEHVFLMEYKPLTNIVELIFFGVLGLATAAVGILYVKVFYGLHHLFRKLSLPKPLKPMVGGLLTGSLALAVPQVLGGGYEWMAVFVEGFYPLRILGSEYIVKLYDNIWIALPLLTILLILKMLATGFSVGSGGSGGVFAPGLFIGGVVGLILSLVMTQLFPGVVEDRVAFTSSMVIVGMVSLFGGVSKAPLSVLIMVSEMTGSYELMGPAMLSIALSYFLTGRYTIYAEQVEDRSKSPAHWRRLK